MTKSPAASSIGARNTMRANRPVSRRETAFRLALWHEGVRGYRLHPRLPGRPDIVFPRLRLAIFVHGCFWHRCPMCRPPQPRANAPFWNEKLTSNEQRDASAVGALTRQGWEVLVVWEHEIRPDPTPRAVELAGYIAERRRTTVRRRGK